MPGETFSVKELDRMSEELRAQFMEKLNNSPVLKRWHELYEALEYETTADAGQIWDEQADQMCRILAALLIIAEEVSDINKAISQFPMSVKVKPDDIGTIEIDHETGDFSTYGPDGKRDEPLG